MSEHLPRRIVTKHCKPVDRDRMLAGNFRIGTLGNFRQMEGQGLYSDSQEGCGGFSLMGEHKNIDLFLPDAGMWHQNISFTNPPSGVAFSIFSTVDAHVFCASNGGYNHGRHEKLLQGSSHHAGSGNPDITAFLEMDVDRLRDMIGSCLADVFRVRVQVVCGPVRYGQRTTPIFSPAEFENVVATSDFKNEVSTACFVKPDSFAVEDEYRFLALASKSTSVAIEPILTERFSARLRRNFRKAIVSSGVFTQSPE